MRKVKLFFLFSLFFSSSTLFFLPFIPIAALDFTCQPFWFFIDEPQTINFPEMYFRVGNKNENRPLEISCSYQHIEGVDLRVDFEVQTYILAPRESKMIHYTIHANLTYAVTYNLEINIRQKVNTSEGATTIVGGSIINKVTFFTDEQGAILLVQAVNQVGTPRYAIIQLFYRVNASYIWTPIESREGVSEIEGVFPLGEYLIRVTDLATGIHAEKMITLTNNSIVPIPIQLVGFREVIPIMGSHLGVQLIVYNHLETLTDLTIYVELYQEETLISTTDEFQIAPVPPMINQKITLFFGDAEIKKDVLYTFKAYMMSGGVRLASYTEDYTFVNFPRSPPRISWTELIIYVGGIGIIIVGILIRLKKGGLTHAKKNG